MSECKGEIILTARPGEVGIHICDQAGKIHGVCFEEDLKQTMAEIAHNLRVNGFEVKC